ncbi:uncharacterized protein LOC108096141 [Drosophila ficusphila]|uniref:uncharacterized protein LOC108096141 n=1 Tax=Drosophila ficusphila TaxID=30025 RepID=UPI001C8A74A1|nr:uncharacterized protein LOC108096141 [Drosophila ficusphila]
MSEPSSKIRRINFSESDITAEYIIESLKEEITYLRGQNASLHQKLDLMAEKLAENNALLKIRTKAEHKEGLSGVPFPLKSDDNLNLFEATMTPTLRDYYKQKITNMAKNDHFVKAVRMVLDENLVQNYNLDGSSGKKSLKGFSNLYQILKEVSEAAAPLEDAEKT